VLQWGVFLTIWSDLLWLSFGLTSHTTPTARQTVFLTGFIFAITISFFLTKEWSLKLCYFVLSGVILCVTYVITVLVKISLFWPRW